MTRFRWEIALVIALTILTVWLALGERLPGWLVGEREIAVRVARVRKVSIPATARVSGALLPVNEIHVVSPLAGRVIELRVKAGDSVRAGAVIATIHASDIAERQAELEAAVRLARKDLTEKERRLGSAEQLAAQRRELYKQDLIARRDVEQAQAALQTIRAETELARAHLTQQEAMLAQAQKIQSLGQISAPSTGVVTRRWAEPGALIAASSPLVSIASSNLIKFAGRVTSAHAATLREGSSAIVLAGESIEGIVSRVIASADKSAAGAEIEIQVKAAPGKFRFGMAADAEITLENAKEFLRIPQSAVVDGAGSYYVYKLGAGRAIRQAVSLGVKEGDEVVVEQGVSAGDSVIVDKLDELKPSSRVRPLLGAPGS